MTQNVWYNYTVDINPPDNIKEVINAIVFFDVYINPTRNFTIMVNNQFCRSSSYYISTTYATSSQARIYFDCGNIINKTGTYNVSLRVTGGNVGSLIGWLDLTYMNDPKADIFMYGTEYNSRDLGKVWLQLLDNQKNPVNNATCLVNVYYPDNNKFINNAIMEKLEKGIYYYDFIVPNYQGVYPAIAECFYVTNETRYVSSSATVIKGTSKAGSYLSTHLDDNVIWEIEEANGGVTVMFNFTGIPQPQFISFVDIIWSGIWKKEKRDVSVDNIRIYVWNFTSSSWQLLPNQIYYSGTEYKVTNSFQISNLSTSGIYKNGNMALLFNDSVSDATKTKFKTDYLAISFIYLAFGEFQEVKGSSEIHVHDADGYYMVGYCPFTNMEFDDYTYCSYFTNDNEFNEIEGEIEQRIRVYSTVTSFKETYFTYESPYSIDCSALYWIKYYNGTDWVDVEDYQVSSNVNMENCHITIPIVLEKDKVYEYWFKFDNYLKWEVLWTKDLLDYISSKLTQVCYTINSTHNYSVPIDVNTYLGEGATRYCHRIFDDIYWWNYYYNASKNITNTGEYLSYFIETRFYRRALYDHILSLNGYMNNVSIGNVSFDDSNIIAAVNNLHSSIVSVNNTVISANNTLSYMISQIPYNVWNFATRTLTEFNFLVDLTTDSINSILNPIFTNFNFINSRLNSIEEKIDELNLLTYQLNQSIFYELNNQYYILQNINQSVYDNNQELKQKIDYLNQSLNYINNNIISVNNSIYVINNSLALDIDKVYSLSKEINQSLQSLNVSLNVSINPSDIWEYPNRTLTYYPEYNDTELKQMILSLSNNISQNIENIEYNLLYVNQTILSRIENLNNTISSNLENITQMIYLLKQDLSNLENNISLMNDSIIYRLDYINSSIYQIRDDIIQAIIDNALTAKQVWEYAYRNLTYYPEFNYTEMANQVWNYDNRTLTVYQNITLELEGVMEALFLLNNTVISSYSNLSQDITSTYNLVNQTYENIMNLNNTLYLVNSSIINQILSIPEINYSEIANQVWIYENRSLTDLNVNVSVNVSIDDSKLYAINSSLANLIDYNFNNTNQMIYALDNNMANNFTYTLSQLYNLNGTIEYYISNSTNNLTAYIQNITILTAEDVWTYQIRTLTTAVNVTAGNISTVENAYATFTDVRYAGATEYASGETSQISYLFLNTQSGNPEPITNGDCYLNVYYPNKTKLINNQLMYHLENGLYYYNFTAPSYSGVYTSKVYCSNGTFSGIGASTFHVAPWANAIFLLQTNSSQQYSNLMNYLLLRDADVFTEKTCLNNNTLGIKYIFNVSINGDKIPIEKIEKVYCENGCDNGKCIPKSELNILTFLLITILGLGLALIPRNMILQILGALILIIESVYLLSSGIEIASLDLLGTSYSYVLNNTITLLIALTLLGIALVKLSLSFNLFKR